MVVPLHTRLCLTKVGTGLNVQKSNEGFGPDHTYAQQI